MDATKCEQSQVGDNGKLSLVELMTAGDLAKRLRISIRQVRKLHSEALVPAPVKLGRSARWRTTEIGEWVAAGCPSREAWEKRAEQRRLRVEPVIVESRERA